MPETYIEPNKHVKERKPTDTGHDSDTESFTEYARTNVGGRWTESGDSLSSSQDNEKRVPKNSMRVPFWTENPNVLLQKEYLLEFFPVEQMTYSQKLNAISRAIVVMCLFLFVFTQNPYVFIIALFTLGAVAIVFHNQHRNTTSPSKKLRFKLNDDSAEIAKESFANKSDGLAKYTIDNEKVSLSPNLFDKSKPNNPFSNVLLTDYENNPTKKPAPAAYNAYTNADILGQAKEFVKQANPDQPDIADKLFKDLGEELQFEQSMRPFYSNPATTIPNDQQAFADFCYGSMVSCKEGNMFACSRKYQTMPVA